MDRAVERLAASWEQTREDLKVCHEYYCRANCHTLYVEGPPSPAGPHTPRCRRLREEYGFPSYPREVPLDLDALLKASEQNPKRD